MSQTCLTLTKALAICLKSEVRRVIYLKNPIEQLLSRMNTYNHNVCLQLCFLSHALRSCLLAAFTSKRSLEVIGFFPDLQLTAIITLKQVLMWEAGGIQWLGQKAVSEVIWDPGLGRFPSDLGRSTSAAHCLCSLNLIHYDSFQSN